MQNVIVYGTTDLAEVLLFHLESDERYNVVACCVDKKYITSDKMGKYPVVAFEDVKELYPPSDYAFFVCIGYTGMNEGRRLVFQRIMAQGYSILTYIHPSALVQTQEIGEGCLVFENVTIGPYCEIGCGNIFYPCSHLAHHSTVGDFNFFAISSSIAGHVKVGNQCFFGNNSTTRDKIIIADKTLLGAGGYLAVNSNEGDVYVPARSVKLEKKSNEVNM
jgi:sugar O-acyltransferase (sialic acid O-acetyltransferase NeuD family)